MYFGWSTSIGNASLSGNDFNDKVKLWYLSLRHVSEISLVNLAKQDFVISKKLNKLEYCDYCILGQQYRVKFKSDMHNSS